MLILTRRIGESVVIGEDIYCTILGLKDGQVRLGFDAPETIPVNRDEIHRRIQLEKRQGNIEELLTIDETIIDRLIAKFKKQDSLNTH